MIRHLTFLAILAALIFNVTGTTALAEPKGSRIGESLHVGVAEVDNTPPV